jgi:hypothetical protein
MLRDRNGRHESTPDLLQKPINLKWTCGVIAVYHCQLIEFDRVLLQFLESAQDAIKRRCAILIHAMAIMQIRLPVDQQADQEAMFRHELAPIVVNQSAVGLQRIMDDLALRITLLQFYHLAEEFHSKQRWLASLPREVHLFSRLGGNVLLDVILHNSRDIANRSVSGYRFCFSR